MVWDEFNGFHAGYFGLFAIIYTAVVLRREISFRKPFIVPGRFAQPLGATIAIHLCYLSGVFALYCAFVLLNPLAPSWLLQNVGNRSTGFSFLFLVFLIGLAFLERKHIFREVQA